MEVNAASSVSIEQHCRDCSSRPTVPLANPGFASVAKEMAMASQESIYAWAISFVTESEQDQATAYRPTNDRRGMFAS